MNMDTINLCIKILLLIGVLNLCFKFPKYLFNSLELKRYISELNIQSSMNDRQLLDSIIQECFATYITLTLEYEKDLYITDEIHKKIIIEVSEDVSNKLSPILLNKIALVYNIDNLPDIISEKIYLLTTDYAFTKNKPKEV